jgi:hypothetical protein
MENQLLMEAGRSFEKKMRLLIQVIKIKKLAIDIRPPMGG